MIRKNSRNAITSSRHSAWKIAEEHGVDMSLIENNLRISPIKRIMRHEMARHALIMLSTAGRNLNDR
ncbi:MAG: hypothetical protein A2283_02140 [Lentisphaerae bacterium RIFOXYA12_FULL_48_11]|nr:MAG: hypothetical protein A2283_02140 [Lentisphaerae bacterium RIFOXYA12_FULL_48_11]